MELFVGEWLVGEGGQWLGSRRFVLIRRQVEIRSGALDIGLHEPLLDRLLDNLDNGLFFDGVVGGGLVGTVIRREFLVDRLMRAEPSRDARRVMAVHRQAV